MQIVGGDAQDILPTEFSVENKVYEYGGPLFDITNDGQVIFSNMDNTLRVLNTETQQVSLLPTQPGFRYSSFNANAKSAWVLAVEEDHTSFAASEITHSVVAINVATAAVQKVATGADFYHAPCFSLDGTRMAWLEWDNPGLPFNAAKLYDAEWDDNGTITNIRLITAAQASVTEPRWGHDGSLFFAQEVAGYRQLFHLPLGSNKPVLINLAGLEEAEFGQVDLLDGSRTYVPVSMNRIFAIIAIKGVHMPIVINLDSLSWREVAQSQNIVQVMLDAVSRLTDSSVLVVAQSVSSGQALYKIDLDTPYRNTIIRKTLDEEEFKADYSVPETLCIESRQRPSRKIYGFLWMPHNKNLFASTGELPPLIIDAHGGPTWMAGSGLDLKIQYFTSRGYAYAVINYTGSTGYGKDYRESLFGSWGILDASDAAECAEYLASTGRVNSKAIGISGHSAGGYCVLQCLTLFPHLFAAGVCAAGVSDVKALSDTTHKLELHYADLLLGCYGLCDEDKLRIYHQRSAIRLANRIKSPLLMLHGELDTVVPIGQMREMARKLAESGAEMKLVEVEGEGHMLDSPSAVRIWLMEEEAWWRKTLLMA